MVRVLPCSLLTVTEPELLMLTSPPTVVKVGTPLALARSTWPDVPAVVTCRAPVPLPYSTPLEVNVPAPVPPLATLNVPAQLRVRALLAILPWTLVSLTTLVGAALLMVLPDWVRPLPALGLLMVTQAVPFHWKVALWPLGMVLPSMVKLAVPTLST